MKTQAAVVALSLALSGASGILPIEVGPGPAGNSATTPDAPQEWTQYRLHADKNAVLAAPEAEQSFGMVYETNDEVRATPVVVGERMFVGNHNSGDLFAFDLRTGAELWSSQAPNWIHSEMIYADGSVYAGFGNRFPQDSGNRGTGDSGVIALDAATGEIRWQFDTDGEVMPTPVLLDGALYAVTGDPHLYKIDPDTGSLLSSVETGTIASMSSPGSADEMLYYGGGPPNTYTFTAYDTRRDEISWQRDFPRVTSGLGDVPPAVESGLVVTTAHETPENPAGDEGVMSHVLYALDSGSGEVVWRQELGQARPGPNNKSGAPAIHDGKVFVGSPTTKTFYAYDLDSGERIWDVPSGTVKGAPVIKDGTVYFGNTDGIVRAVDAQTGEELGEKEIGGALAPAGPIIVNETLMIGSQDSNVYAVPLQDILGNSITPAWLWPTAGAVVILLAAGLVLYLASRKRSGRRS